MKLVMYCFILCVGEEDPLPLFKTSTLSCLSWHLVMGGNQRVKTLPWSVWVNTLKRDLIETVELSVLWHPEGSLDKIVVNEVYRIIVGKPRLPDQFPYIDWWLDAVFSWPTWLKSCLDETCRIMVARVGTTSMRKEKAKDPILAEEPKEMPSSYVPLYPPLPSAHSSAPSPLTSDGEAWGTLTPLKSGLGASSASSPLTSASLLDPMPTLSPPVVTLHLHLIRGIQPISEDPTQTPTAIYMLLSKVQGPMHYDQKGQIQEGG
jgi:hypothetical protein